MSRHDTGTRTPKRTADDGWEVARPLGGVSLDGVQMAGFRDRTAAGLDMRVLPQPAVIVVIGLGVDPVMVESPSGHRPQRGLGASSSPGPARIRGEGVECVEVALSPRAAYALLGVSPLELDGCITGLEDLWGRHARLLREQVEETTSWQEPFALTEGFPPACPRPPRPDSPYPDRTVIRSTRRSKQNL
ncbi:hypothetical protein [Streptomyces sp. NPDC090022]|uniref:hypothetical protein n=1 Tax=Streptomyces sp. NPDC090022 TaxID=3365920 RepID=UPI00382C4CF7